MSDRRKEAIPVSSEEEEYRKKCFPEVSKVVNGNPLCTSCNQSVKINVINRKPLVHPLMGTLLCEKCHQFYGDGEFSLDEDGSDKYCRWCGQGGTIFQCSKCPAGFCKKCIKRNLSRKILAEVDKDDWLCFCCCVNPLWELRALAWAAVRHADSIKKPPTSPSSSFGQSEGKRKNKKSSDSQDDLTKIDKKRSSLLTKHLKNVSQSLNHILGSVKSVGSSLKKKSDEVAETKCKRHELIESGSENAAVDAVFELIHVAKSQIMDLEMQLKRCVEDWNKHKETISSLCEVQSSTAEEPDKEDKTGEETKVTDGINDNAKDNSMEQENKDDDEDSEKKIHRTNRKSESNGIILKRKNEDEDNSDATNEKSPSSGKSSKLSSKKIKLLSDSTEHENKEENGEAVKDNHATDTDNNASSEIVSSA